MAKTRGIENRVIALSLIDAHPRNYNKHSAAQLADLAASLEQFGQVRSIVVQQKGKRFIAVAGHGIAEAARSLGWTEIRADVIPASWSQTRVLAYLAADNELARRGDPDQDQLAAIVKEVMDAEGAALARLAAGEQSALDALLVRANPKEETADAGELIDKAAELQKKWNVQRGDIWTIGKHRLMCGDSTSAEDVATLMGGEKAQLVFSDPPYNVSYQDNESVESLKARNRRTDGLTVSNDSMTDEQFDSFLFLFLSELPLEKGGSFYLCAPPGHPETQFRNALNSVSGLALKQCIVWVKDVFVFGRQDYHWRHESILYGWKEGAAHYFIDDHTQDTVWEIERPRNSKEHPTMKPIALAMKAISNSSKVGNIAFDGFNGSGTTLVACEQTGRIGRGMEIEPKYCSVTLERLELLGLSPKRLTDGKKQGKTAAKIPANREV